MKMGMITKKGYIRGNLNSQKRITELKVRNDVVETPHWICERIADWSMEIDFASVLDPCAGDNKMIQALRKRKKTFLCTSFDTAPQHPDVIKSNFFDLIPSQRYDLVVMNPPFSKLQGLKIMKKLIEENWLYQNWRIITIFPNYYLDNGNKRKGWLDQYIYRTLSLPTDAFAPKCNTLHSTLCEFRQDNSGRTVFYV